MAIYARSILDIIVHNLQYHRLGMDSDVISDVGVSMERQLSSQKLDFANWSSQAVQRFRPHPRKMRLLLARATCRSTGHPSPVILDVCPVR